MDQIKDLKTGIKYKDTPIGKIPVDWEVVRLSDVSEINMGQSPPSEDCSQEAKGLPFYQGNAEFGSKYPSPQKWCDKPKKIANQGDILVSVRAPVGEINIAPHKCCIGGGLAAVSAKAVHDEFLYHSLFLHMKALQKIAQGSTFEAINRKELSDLLIFLPPAPEQKKIATILITVDEAIEKTNQIIEKAKEVKKGLMQELLTRGIGHKKFKKTEIGEIPAEWEVFRLGDACHVIGGSTPSTNKKEYWEGDILFATPTDITNLNGREISDTEQKITQEGLSSCGTNLLPVGSILLTSRATIGACAINTKPMATNQGFASLVCNEKAYNWFVLYKIISLQHELQRLGSGSTFKEVSKKSVRSLIFPLPPLPEQKQIAAILSSVDEEIEKEANHKERLEVLKKGLMQVLLTGKIRVSV